MWQHRQEERELKRTEMDIIRQKKQVNKSLKSYESSKWSSIDSFGRCVVHVIKLSCTFGCVSEYC